MGLCLSFIQAFREDIGLFRETTAQPRRGYYLKLNAILKCLPRKYDVWNFLQNNLWGRGESVGCFR